MIGGLLDSLPPALPLIVVDNASADDTLAIVAAKRADARVLRNAVGLGYGRAASRGLAEVTTEFALLANPDSLLSEDAIRALVDAADAFPDAAMLSPVHTRADGGNEPSHDVDLWKRGRYPRRDGEPRPDGPLCAEFLSGAVNLLRMEMLRRIGFFDPEIFLYYEDDDLCLRLRQAGYSLVLVPSSEVVHLDGGSVRTSPAYYWEKFWHIAWSRVYVEGKYRGRGARLVLGVGHGLRYAVKTIGNGLAGRAWKCRRDAARCAGSWSALFGARAAVDDRQDAGR